MGYGWITNVLTLTTPAPPPDAEPRTPWRWLARRRQDRTALYHRLHDLAAELEGIAERVGARENDRGGDTPDGYRLGEIAEELDRLSHG